MILTPTTKLQAINTLLASIGEAPVSQEGSGLDEEALAAETLDEVSRAVQLIGWSWNKEDGFPLTPDGAGNIALPVNTLKVDFQNSTLVARGRKVYDKSAHSYSFQRALKATIVFGLAWDELPEAMRSYIMYRAGRLFQTRQVSAQILHQFTKEDENAAWVSLISSENEVSNVSIFDNIELQLMLDRSPSLGVIDYPAGGLGGLV